MLHINRNAKTKNSIHDDIYISDIVFLSNSSNLNKKRNFSGKSWLNQSKDPNKNSNKHRIKPPYRNAMLIVPPSKFGSMNV